jgi:hypothetical protein
MSSFMRLADRNGTSSWQSRMHHNKLSKDIVAM